LNHDDGAAVMKTVLIVAISLLLSAFVALFHPNEYAWMQDEFSAGQIPEDADLMFKLGGAFVIHGLIQVTALFLLLRSGRKTLGISLAVVAAAAALLLLQRA
jgi:di/tricarboxylate transporter